MRCMRSCLGAREKESPRLMHVVALHFTLYLSRVPPGCPNGVSLSGRRIAVESRRARASDRGSGGGLDRPLSECASISSKSSVACSAGSEQGCCSARPRLSSGARGAAPLGSEWPASQATAGGVGEVALDMSERGGNGVAPALQTCARLEQVLGLAVVSAAV